MTSASDGSRGSSMIDRRRNAARHRCARRRAALPSGRADCRQSRLRPAFPAAASARGTSAAAAAICGRWREAAGARLRSARKVLTMRSSSEWKATTTSRPDGLSTRSAAARPRASSASSSLTKIRSAWKVRVAGWIVPSRARTTRATMSASARVVSIARSSRALTIARATARAWCSSPSVAMMAARSRSLGARRRHRRRSDRRGPCACRAVRRAGTKIRARLRRAASTKRRDRTRRRRPRPRRRRRRSIPDWRSDPRPGRAGPALRSTSAGALRDRALVAVDADHARAGRRQDRARIAAGAERRVDIEAAVTHAEPVDGAAGEHGNVTSQSASDSIAVAARHHSRAPMRFCRRHPGAQLLLESADLLGGLREFRAKAAGLPDSKFVAETDEGRRVGDPGMRLERVGEHHAALAVDLQRLARCRRARARTARAGRNRARSRRSAPRSPRAAHCRRHRAPAGRARDSNKDRRSRRAPAPRGRMPAPRRVPWRPDGACSGTRSGPSRPSPRRKPEGAAA